MGLNRVTREKFTETGTMPSPCSRHWSSLGQRLFQNKQVQLPNGSAALQLPEELVWQDQPPVVIHPADQGLRAAQGAGASCRSWAGSRR